MEKARQFVKDVSEISKMERVKRMNIVIEDIYNVSANVVELDEEYEMLIFYEGKKITLTVIGINLKYLDYEFRKVLEDDVVGNCLYVNIGRVSND